MKPIELKATVRKDTNTRAARRHRGNGQVPGVVYGGAAKDGAANREVTHITVDKDELNLLFKKHALLIDLAVDGKKDMTIVKEVQRDALGEFVMHVDFERVDLKKPIQVEVALNYKGVPKGTTKGGHLRIETYRLMVQALPTSIPDEILVKIDDLDLDAILRLKDIKLPEGVKALIDEDHVLCAVRAAVEEKEPEAAVAGAEGAPSEPEVIGRKKAEDEEAEGEEEKKK